MSDAELADLMHRLQALARRRSEQILEPFHFPVEKHTEWIAADRLDSLKRENDQLCAENARLIEALKNAGLEAK